MSVLYKFITFTQIREKTLYKVYKMYTDSTNKTGHDLTCQKHKGIKTI